MKPLIITASLFLLATSFTLATVTNSNNTISVPTQTIVIDNVNSNEFKKLLASNSLAKSTPIFATISQNWSQAYIPQAIETAINSGNLYIYENIIAMLQVNTGKKLGRDFDAWYQWLWNQPEVITADYANFKADIYKHLDPKFDKYFRNRQSLARIRLDEIRWGGVIQDGIPPLRQPKMIKVKEANYLRYRLPAKL